MFGIRIQVLDRRTAFVAPTNIDRSKSGMASRLYSPRRGVVNTWTPRRSIGGPIGTVMTAQMVRHHAERLRRLDPGASCGAGDHIAYTIEAWVEHLLDLGASKAFAWGQTA